MNNKTDIAPFDYSEAQLRKIFNKTGLTDKDIDKACQDYMSYRQNEMQSLFPPGLNMRKEIEKDLKAFQEDKEIEGSFYNNVVKNMRPGAEIVKEILSRY